MINLIPNDLRDERSYGRRNRILFGYVVALAVAAALVAVIMIGSINFVSDDEKTIQASIEKDSAQVTALEADISNLSKVATKLTATDKLYESSIAFSELIPEIGSLLPEGSILNGLSLTGGNTDPLALDVIVSSADIVPIFQSNLVGSELFEAADVNSISARDDEGQYKFSAALSVSFTGSAEAKRKAAAAAAAAAQAAAEAANEGSQQQ